MRHIVYPQGAHSDLNMDYEPEIEYDDDSDPFPIGTYYVLWKSEDPPPDPYIRNMYRHPVDEMPCPLRHYAKVFKKLKEENDLCYDTFTVYWASPEFPHLGRVYALLLGPMPNAGSESFAIADHKIRQVQERYLLQCKKRIDFKDHYFF